MQWLKNLWRRIVRKVRSLRIREQTEAFVAESLREILPPILQNVRTVVAQQLVGAIVQNVVAMIVRNKWLRVLFGNRDVWATAVQVISRQRWLA